uniref:Uncharacterized protein n=1 Tax=Anopheles farauti TaxID=69004 RepID=A0A182QT52_9DIPT
MLAERLCAVSAMVRSCVVALLVSSIVLSVCLPPPVGKVAAYVVEREATVELLPNDLLAEEPARVEEENQAITTPQKAINNGFVKMFQAMRRVLQDTNRSLMEGKKEKRNLPTTNFLPYAGLLLMLCRNPYYTVMSMMPPGTDVVSGGASNVGGMLPGAGSAVGYVPSGISNAPQDHVQTVLAQPLTAENDRPGDAKVAWDVLVWGTHALGGRTGKAFVG